MRRESGNPGQNDAYRYFVEDEDVTQTIEYCLLKYNIDLHAIVIEANHIHRVDTDTDGIRPKFIGDFHFKKADRRAARMTHYSDR